jgi:ABC-type phosphate transport system auxiliary subunit
LFAEGKKEVVKKIEEVTGPKGFIVSDWIDPIDNVFVYGKKVTDFRAIDFDQITALSVAAIQELSKQIQKLQIENAALNKLIKQEIHTKQSALEKRLLQLELKLKKKRK